MLNNGWRTLDYNIPDDIPFDLWMEHLGAEAKIWVTHVGNHNAEAEAVLCYTEGAVTQMPLNKGNIEALLDFDKRARKWGVATLYQPVQPTPKAPVKYKILHPRRCVMEDGYCDHRHDGYCEPAGRKKTVDCEHVVVSNQVYVMDNY